MRNEYFINKLRFGRDGSWKPWVFEVYSIDSVDKTIYHIPIKGYDRYGTLSDVAKKLATLEEIKVADLTPGEFRGNNRKVSISYYEHTQYGITTDEDLGDLASLIFRIRNKGK